MRVCFVLVLALLFGAVFPPPAQAWDVVLNNAARDVPECASWGAGRLDCLVRLSNGHMGWIAYAQGKWSPMQDLGGNLPSAPSCVVRATDSL